MIKSLKLTKQTTHSIKRRSFVLVQSSLAKNVYRVLRTFSVLKNVDEALKNLLKKKKKEKISTDQRYIANQQMPCGQKSSSFKLIYKTME